MTLVIKMLEIFLDILDEQGFVQHVVGATHIRGHTLDVFITRDNSSILLDNPSILEPHLCDGKGNHTGDHMAISSVLQIQKPANQRKSVSFRKYRNIVIDDLNNDILNSNALPNPSGSIDELVETYNTQLSAIIDKHAPVQSKTIILRPNTKWYTKELRTAKQDRRKSKRKMRKSKLTVDIQIYRVKCNSVSKTNKQYLSDKIEEIGNDSKQLFKLTNNIMGKTKETILPSIDDKHQLANRFGRFFL